ncbi:putative alpha beta hydrolase fold protein [Phaeoacremonium minimum UCRPA7]|uniref:Putative alpha beta hydrolase fold protein n=1 Tax=Phaeoacremonium minimum (strain UCR-PA7) TaxID=1286976 RepID=R8B8S0_PHAM7|nr:putative alpha beta hydrolase fold protein [Phaeoacremonium minimum UCRPA7]EON95704.1 putative alpha beta hydrolase fold protein [Phaeoacremonium minimum UCRPA7]
MSTPARNPLPTLFTIHGGGFCLGAPRDDDEWNRAFADRYGVQVVALSYTKAPSGPFPTALHDLEALYLAVVADASIPTDNRTALLGFSAGGNLALTLSQLPTIQECTAPPRAVTSVYGCLDLSLHSGVKTGSRQYKPTLSPPRNSRKDALLDLVAVFDWSYIPYGQELRDPLLSPAYAPRSALPPYVCIVAAELDMLAHESWRMACRLANEEQAARGLSPARRLPDATSTDKNLRLVGREQPAKSKGKLETNNERFGWEERWDGSGIKWLLVPDVTHGFDNVHIRELMGGKESIRDAEAKTDAYCRVVAEWLLDVVWKT